MHFLHEGNIEELKKITYVNLHSHIAKLRKFSGNITDAHWKESKIRASNAIGILLNKNRPKKISDIDPEWNDIVDRNNALINWAINECKKHQGYKCKPK